LTDETFQIEETASPKGGANSNKKRKSNKEGGDVHDSSSIANIPLPKRKSFEERLVALAAYKAKHGDCNAPQTPSSEYYSLGAWCSEIRQSYKKIQQGKTSLRNPLSQDQIGRLEALGFEWITSKVSITFDERFIALAAYKAKHGDFIVPKKLLQANITHSVNGTVI